MKLILEMQVSYLCGGSTVAMLHVKKVFATLKPSDRRSWDFWWRVFSC